MGEPTVSRRVIHYIDSEVYGGTEEAALHLMASLERAHWDPLLVYHPAPGIARLVQRAEQLGIPAHGIPRVERGARLSGVNRLRGLFRRERPALVHAHLSWPFACKHGVLAAWLAGVPAIVGTAQLFLPADGTSQPRWVLRGYRRIIAVSEEVRRRYAQELGVPARRLAVVHNAIRVPPLGPRRLDLRATLLDGRPDYLVLTPARLHPQKGHAFLIAAAAEIPGATFVFAGDGPLRGALETQAREQNVSDRCVFLGERTDVPELLAAADLVVLPSLFEGLPVSVLEAMAAERPVIATAIGGTDEAVTTEVSGLLVPPRDPSALAAAIRRLAGDPALAQRLAAAGRARVERSFSADATARQVMRIYDEAVGPEEP
jgi:glycosyltransferase involved in cell wall biosynthesis